MLEARLQAVLEQITAQNHVDIGSDHAYLPIELLRTGRVERCLVVEKHLKPAQRAADHIRAAGVDIEVRLGDGLQPIRSGEVDSVSLTGMGAKLMVHILQAGDLRAVQQIVCQPNDSAEPLRRFAVTAGFELQDEQLIAGFWRYPVLRFARSEQPAAPYQRLPAALPVDTAYHFGPVLLLRKDATLQAELEAQQRRLAPLQVHGRADSALAWQRVQQALAWYHSI